MKTGGSLPSRPAFRHQALCVWFFRSKSRRPGGNDEIGILKTSGWHVHEPPPVDKSARWRAAHAF